MTLDIVESLLPLVEAADRHDSYPQVATLESLIEEFSEPGFVPEDDGCVAYLDGQLAGWAWVIHRPSDGRLERAYLAGGVDPSRRRHGVGRALLIWGRDRAVTKLVARPNDLPKFVRVDACDGIADAHRLYGELGFRPMRWFEDLERPVAGFGDVAAPVGATIVPWPLERTDEILAVRNQAFADHWGSTNISPGQWEYLLNSLSTRTDLCFVAIDDVDGKIVGFVLNAYFAADERLHPGRRDGWIEQVGTLRAWRGRGICSALIASSVNAFAGAGLTHASLNVDSDNPSGAAGLYRHLGFESVYRSITHQFEVLS